MLKELSHFQQRLVMGGAATLIVVLFIWLSPYHYFRPFFTLITAGIIAAAVWEYYQIARNKEWEPLDMIGVIATIAYVFSVFLATQTDELLFLPEVVLWLTLLIVFTNYFVKGPNPFVNTSLTVFALAYLTVPLACLINITYFFPKDSIQEGRWWLLFLIATTKMTDTGAYFCGKKFGKNKMAPYISPGKTWEGAVGGFLMAILTGIFLYVLTNRLYHPSPLNLSLIQCICLAGVIGVIAQFGDLAESLLKRDVGVKDSNQWPGLGGMLDIVDSLVFTAPLVYIYLRLGS